MTTIDDDNLMILQNWYTEFEFRFTKYLVNSANCLKYDLKIYLFPTKTKSIVSCVTTFHTTNR